MRRENEMEEDRIVEGPDHEEHMKSLFMEMEAYSTRLTTKTTIVWFVTIAGAVVGVGHLIGSEQLQYGGSVFLVCMAGSNLLSVMLFGLKTAYAKRLHREWHEEHPEVDHHEDDE